MKFRLFLSCFCCALAFPAYAQQMPHYRTSTTGANLPQAVQPTAVTPHAGRISKEWVQEMYTLLSERFIDPYPVSTLAVYGLDSLGGGKSPYVVTGPMKGTELFLTVTAPNGTKLDLAGDDIPAWTEVTAAALNTARQRDVTLRKSSPQAAYQVLWNGILNQIDPGKGEYTPPPPTKRSLLNGQTNAQVSAHVFRQKNKSFTLNETSPQEREATYRVSNGILTIEIKNFSPQTAHQIQSKFGWAREKALREERPLYGILIDLRGNEGGLLSEALAVADLFMTSGPIIEMRGRHPESFQQFEATAVDMTDGLPISVIVNEKTSHAAEALAGALQDSRRGRIFGSRTAGDGSVQTTVLFPDGGEVKFTWAYLYTPKGQLIHGTGITPDIPSSREDPPLRQAISHLENSR